MDRIARLERELARGFAAVDDGDLDVARACVLGCQRIDRNHPEVVELAAAVADASADFDAALDYYRQLSELLPDHAMPLIGVARLELHHVGDPSAALTTVDRALDHVEEEADLIDAILIKADSLIALARHRDAQIALAELSTSIIDDPELALDLAELSLAAEDPDAAKRWIEVARHDDAWRADALHVLGRIHEREGDRPSMIVAWQEVLRLDRVAPPGPVTVSEDEIERIALATLAELPDHIRGHLERVPILIDDAPSEDVVGDGFDPRSLGLFQGSPMSEAAGLAPTITHILLYKRNLERDATDPEHLAEEVRITVLHETAHYFGLDEEELEALGLD